MSSDALAPVLAGFPSLLVGYSGGVDSALLAVAARRVLGSARMLAVLGVSPSLPGEQHRRAREVAGQFEGPLLEVGTDERDDPAYVAISLATLVRLVLLYRPLRILLSPAAVFLVASLALFGRFASFYLSGLSPAGHVQSLIAAAVLGLILWGAVSIVRQQIAIGGTDQELWSVPEALLLSVLPLGLGLTILPLLVEVYLIWRRPAR